MGHLVTLHSVCTFRIESDPGSTPVSRGIMTSRRDNATRNFRAQKETPAVGLAGVSEAHQGGRLQTTW